MKVELDAGSSVLETSIAQVVSALVNERAVSVAMSEGTLTALIRPLNDKPGKVLLTAPAIVDELTLEVQVLCGGSIVANSQSLGNLADLRVFGLTDNQLDVVASHVLCTQAIEDVLQTARRTPPALLDALTSKPSCNASAQPQTFVNLLRQLDARDAFVLSDSCGNADGVPANPLSNAMKGRIPNAHFHHPAYRSFHEGASEIVAVQSDQESTGNGGLPHNVEEFLKDALKVGALDGISFLHPYTHAVAKLDGRSRSYIEIGRIPAVALMSKRSFVPLGADFQIKTSFDGQITAHDRNIHPGEAWNAITNSSTVLDLAVRHLLPKRLWALPELKWGGFSNDISSTYIVRGGLGQAVSNSGEGLPLNLRAVAGGVLWSRNTVESGVTLFESLIADGFEPLDLYRQIVDGLIDMFWDFVKVGVVPEAHSQNLLYVFDLERKSFEGFVLRDLADALFDAETLARQGIHYAGIYRPDKNEMVVSRLSDNASERRRKVSEMFSYKLLHLNIEPFARLVSTRFNVALEGLFAYVRNSFWRYMDCNPGFPMRDWYESDGYYINERISVLLGATGAGYRKTDHHPFVMASATRSSPEPH